MFWKKKSLLALVRQNQLRAQARNIEMTVRADHDPMQNALACSVDITATLTVLLKEERGICIEQALAVLGALAGAAVAHARQTALPDDIMPSRAGPGQTHDSAFAKRKIAEGEAVGDYHVSLWHLAAGKARQLGAMPDLDLEALFARVSSQVGTEEFGTLDIPREHLPSESPQDLALTLFPKFLPLLERHGVAPKLAHLPFALSAQEFIESGRSILQPDLSVRILMECAVPAANVRF
jgi:hypothetical protein